jgi:hypothetical protein
MAPRTDIIKDLDLTSEEMNPEPEVEDIEFEELEFEIPGETYDEDEEDQLPAEMTHESNLAEHLDIDILNELSSDLIEAYEDDVQSRDEWTQIATTGVDLLGFKVEERSDPFPGACGAAHPVLAQSVVKFQAKAIKELYPSMGPVRTQIMGAQTPEKQEQANRVRDFMNYQTKIMMPEYGTQLDKLLFYAALYGSAIKKTYWDNDLVRPKTMFIKAEDFVIDYFATDLESAERYTHRYLMSPNELRKAQVSGEFRDVELSEPEDPEIGEEDLSSDELHGQSVPAQTSQHTILEMHVNIDLPDTPFADPDGIARPHIVIINQDDEQILAIYRNWKENDERKNKRVWFTHYCFIPGLGFYGYGYLHLIGGLASTATKTLQQLIDAGTYANLPAGFKSHGMRVLMPDTPIAPGEWREVNTPAGDLAKSLQPLPYKEPSGTLFQLMQFVVEAAMQFADATDNVLQESSNYGPVGTTMALLEQSTKLYTAIHKRMHDAQALDLKMLAEINFEFMPDGYPYDVPGGQGNVFKQDFDPSIVDVVPVSDPNMPTESHRIAKINAVMGFAAQDPKAHNMQEIRLDMYRALGIEGPERYLAQQAQPFTGDPISEIAAAISGSPLSVEPTQSHDAHITAHAAVLKNPAYQDNLQLQQTMMEHINAHLAMKYKFEVLQLINDPQMTEAVMSGQPMPPEMQNAIAIKVAAVADTLNNFDQAKADALAGISNDPVIKMQQEEVARDTAQKEHDKQMDYIDRTLKYLELTLEDENKDLDRTNNELVSVAKILSEIHTKGQTNAVSLAAKNGSSNES